MTIKITTCWNVARLKFAEHIKIARADVAILQRKIIKSNGLFVCNIYAACVKVCDVVRYLSAFFKADDSLMPKSHRCLVTL